MIEKLRAFEIQTGYLPGDVLLAIMRGESEHNVYCALDSAIGMLRRLPNNELSDNEACFLKRFGPLNDEYWGN